MGFVSTILGFCGFGVGVSCGLTIGYYLFIYFQPCDVKDPVIRPLVERDSKSLQQLLSEIPLWVKCPDYDRVDWLNKFIEYMWPYLDKAICRTAKDIAAPIIAEQIPKYKIDSVEFETLTLGSLPPTFQGMKVYVTEEKELIMEPSIKWAGNPNVTVAVKAFGLKATVQVVDLQVFAAPRITLKPLVPSFPCFANIFVSLMEKPHVDFGLKLLGADLMSIPGLYRFVQETIKDQVANMYLWPKSLIITDGNLTKSIEGPDLVIHQTKECLDNMGEWCQTHHAASGLTQKVLESTITEEEAEKQVVEFVKRNIRTYTPLLAGNSIYTDLLFLKKFMPNLASLFSHVLVDVSSVKALCFRWYPRDNRKAPKKQNKHRAMDDIKESIAELKYFKEHIFKVSKSKK